MKCVFCKIGETKPEIVTVPIINDESAIIVKNVPADVCQYCGEKYYSVEVTEQLDRLSEEAKQRGTELQVTKFAA
jgi:YgiT-type zinc finger domain-containing protein